MVASFKDNYPYLAIGPFFLASLFTVFLKKHGVEILSLEVMLSYLLLILIGFIPGILMIYGGPWFRTCIIICTFLALIILSQIKTLPFLPLKYSRIGIPLGSLILLAGIYFIRVKLDKLLFVFFGMLFICSLFTPNQSFINVQTYHNSNSDNTSLPPLIYIILDEHIGVEGAPSLYQGQMAALKEHYLSENFKIYGQAYSRESATNYSFATFLNFMPLSKNKLDSFVSLNNGAKFLVTMLQNKLFETLSDKGYKIHVFQSSYLDLCSHHDKFALNECVTYLSGAPSETTKLLERSLAYLKKVFLILHFPLKEEENTINAAAAVLKAETHYKKMLQHLQRGHAYFIHLLIPHGPYLYDEQCHFIGEQKDLDKAYFKQIGCAHTLVNSLLQIIEHQNNSKDNIIIIHGDHGVRIDLPQIQKKNYEYTKEDLIKLFSTWFMVKGPSIQVGYDDVKAPIDYLLKQIVLGEKAPVSLPDPFLHLHQLSGTTKKEFEKKRMPAFNG